MFCFCFVVGGFFWGGGGGGGGWGWGVTERKKDGRKKGIHTDRKTDRKKEERDTLEWTETTREKGWGGERGEGGGGRRRDGEGVHVGVPICESYPHHII